MAHPFADSGRREVGPSGRSYAICATCDRKRIGPGHVSGPRTRAGRPPAAESPPTRLISPPPPNQPPAPIPRVADWRLSMLRLALDIALDGALDRARHPAQARGCPARSPLGAPRGRRDDRRRPDHRARPRIARRSGSRIADQIARPRALTGHGLDRLAGASRRVVIPVGQGPRALPPRRRRGLAVGQDGRRAHPAPRPGRGDPDPQHDGERSRPRVGEPARLGQTARTQRGGTVTTESYHHWRARMLELCTRCGHALLSHNSEEHPTAGLACRACPCQRFARPVGRPAGR